MKPVAGLLMALTVAGMVMGVALISVQNAAPVSLKFLGLRSIQVPLGLMLSVGFAGGAIAAAGLPIAWKALGPSPRRP